MKRDVASPQAYVADVVGEQKELLQAIRGIVRRAAPGIREQLEYGMLSCRGLCSLAAQKHYVSLYVLPSVLVPGEKNARSLNRITKARSERATRMISDSISRRSVAVNRR